MANEKPPPNAAPAVLFELYEAWAAELGRPWKDVIAEAEVSRQTMWRARRGTAGLESAQKIAAVLEAAERKRATPSRTREVLALLREWDDLGARIGLADPSQLEEWIERIREVAKSAQAMYRIRNPLPDRDDD